MGGPAVPGSGPGDETLMNLAAAAIRVTGVRRVRVGDRSGVTGRARLSTERGCAR